MIAVINYGLGNLHSVHKAVGYVCGQARVTDDPGEISRADKLILPGVGAFADGMQGLQQRGLIALIKAATAAGTPLLGICLGMQLLFETGEEMGRHAGLGILPGRVARFDSSGVKVPQIGWNQIEVNPSARLLRSVQSGEYVYFNHSYFCIPEQKEIWAARTDYGIQYASAVESGAVYGVQFHPEKSQTVGLHILKSFVEL
jgi:glutamine amidotransferase